MSESGSDGSPNADAAFLVDGLTCSWIFETMGRTEIYLQAKLVLSSCYGTWKTTFWRTRKLESGNIRPFDFAFSDAKSKGLEISMQKHEGVTTF